MPWPNAAIFIFKPNFGAYNVNYYVQLMVLFITLAFVILMSGIPINALPSILIKHGCHDMYMVWHPTVWHGRD